MSKIEDFFDHWTPSDESEEENEDQGADLNEIANLLGGK